MKKWFIILLRSIPVIAITPLFMILELLHGLGPLGPEPWARANRIQEAKSRDIYNAQLAWAYTGKYKRETILVDRAREIYKNIPKMSWWDKFNYILSRFIFLIAVWLIISILQSS